MLIPKDLLNKYVPRLSILDGMDETIVNVTLYRAFLENTDYICNKIVEGVATWDDYADEKKYRQIAREEINKLR